MIDFHNHFIYNLDDGPETIEESIDMLKCASKQGITQIVQTVHFQHPKMDNKKISLNIIQEKINNLKFEMSKERINIKLHVAAEVFYLPNLMDICNNSLVTVGNGKYMLIEFSTNIFPSNYEKELYKLQNKGITPIIAHPERYRFVQNNLDIIGQWIEKDYVIQLDAGSLIGDFGEKVKKISFQIIHKYGLHLLGSDAHNNKKRNFCLGYAYSFLSDNYNFEIVELLKKNASLLLKGEKLMKIQCEQKHSLLSIIKGKFDKFIK